MSILSLARFIERFYNGELEQDQIYLNYDLLHYNTPKMRYKAYASALGHYGKGLEYPVMKGMVQNQLAAFGINDYSRIPLSNLVVMWARWERINNGLLLNWKYRPGRRGKNVRPRDLPKPRNKRRTGA